MAGTGVNQEVDGPVPRGYRRTVDERERHETNVSHQSFVGWRRLDSAVVSGAESGQPPIARSLARPIGIGHDTWGLARSGAGFACGDEPGAAMGRASRRKRENARQEISQSSSDPTVVQQVIRQGPLPDAHELEAYERIQPGLAERIVAMAEQEAAKRHERSDRALEAEIDDIRATRRERRRGQYLGFLLACIALVVAGIAVYFDAPWVATIITGMSIGSLCLALVKTSTDQQSQQQHNQR